MATVTLSGRKKRAKKSKAVPSGDRIQDEVKEALPIAPDIVDKIPTSSHEVLEEMKAPSPVDAGFQQLHQRQCKGGEHQGDVAVPVAVPEQVTNGHSSGKKSKKKHKKKASAVKPRSADVSAPESTNEDRTFTFEEQVEWCIGQLELGLHRRDATKAQKDSNEKNIRTLRSLKVPLPRKRQLMRNLFGDYRSKMVTTPLPEAGAQAKEPGVTAVEREVAEDCGRFFKHKHSHTALTNAAEGLNSCYEEQEPFRFDFVINS